MDLLTLLAIAVTSGRAFLTDAALAYVPAFMAQSAAQFPQKAISLAMACAGAGRMLYRWPGLRTPQSLLAVAMLAALSVFLPMLGATLLTLAVCISSGRRRLAVASAIAAAWVIGTVYYQLDLSLASKAIIMTATGAAFGLTAWTGWRGGHGWARMTTNPDATPIGSWRQQAGIAASLVAILGAANLAIWQKEQLISNGRAVFIELATIDPRSLMQGDYMSLNFKIPAMEQVEVNDRRHIKVVAKIDARGMARIENMDIGFALASDEIRIELLQTPWGRQPADQAWYFREGEAKRWTKARFGEFRIDDRGHAMLVNLRGPELEKL